MANFPLENRRIWITGASSGIGRQLAEVLAQRGNQIIITGRDENTLNAVRDVAPDNISVVAADISKDACIDSITEQLKANVDALDTVILNAGSCEYVDVETFNAALFSRVFQVNLLGSARCVEACLPLLRKSEKNPHLVAVGSAAAITGLPRSEAYGASKAAIASMFESLGLDLDPLGIDVSVIYPGFVDTPLTRRNDFPMPFLMSSEQACRLMIKGIEKRRSRISFPRRLIWSLQIMALLPGSWRHALGMKMVRQSS